jgi:hypothetical protein
MNSLFRRSLAILIYVLVFAPAFAQDAKPLSPIPANFQFTGAWDCDGAFGNKQAHKSTYAGSVILGGKWLELTEEDLQPATGYLAKYLIGYDSQQKRLVEFDANNFGAAVYSSDDGWQNQTLTMTSPLSQDPKAPYIANRFVFTIAGSDNFSIDWQISRKTPLEWITSDHLVCKRHAS